MKNILSDVKVGDAFRTRGGKKVIFDSAIIEDKTPLYMFIEDSKHLVVKYDVDGNVKGYNQAFDIESKW